LLRRVMGTITGRIFHTLTLTELPQPCLAGVSNTDTFHSTQDYKTSEFANKTALSREKSRLRFRFRTIGRKMETSLRNAHLTGQGCRRSDSRYRAASQSAAEALRWRTQGVGLADSPFALGYIYFTPMGFSVCAAQMRWREHISDQSSLPAIA